MQQEKNTERFAKRQRIARIAEVWPVEQRQIHSLIADTCSRTSVKVGSPPRGRSRARTIWKPFTLSHGQTARIPSLSAATVAS